MIVGVFLRNIKCYGNLNFIPFVHNPEEKLSVFIGDNGVGKSTVLEALDYILNDIDRKYWDITIDQKRDDAVVCPVFLIDKNKFKKFTNKETLDHVSKKFWNLAPSNSDGAIKNFFDWRESLKKVVDVHDYRLISIGKQYGGEIVLTSTFDKKIFNSLKRSSVSRPDVTKLYSEIINSYGYVYIPIESKIMNVLSLQASEMQRLMDKSVVNELTTIFSKKEKNDDLAGEVGKSIIDIINDNLNSYTREINNQLSEGYGFNPKQNQKRNISAEDLINELIRVYFNLRPLTKDRKAISSLSSGQQRLAIIDVATTMLTSNQEKSRDIVFALDEPENSLSASAKFSQFDKLVKISEVNQHQIMLTTHWYGLLLRPSSGRLHFIEEGEKAPDVKSYQMQSLFDQRREFPSSIEMKSYFDLMSSMLSLLKDENNNWLICEGGSDAEYLKLYLSGVDGLHILPFNGCGNIKKLYDFLSVPLLDKKESSHIRGKILLLIDTDTKSTMRVEGYKEGNFKKKLKFSRLSLDRDKDISTLISVADANSTNTEIEDVLEADIVWDALQKIANVNKDLDEILGLYTLNENAKYSDLTGSMKMFSEGSDILAYQKKADLKSLLHSEKFKMSLCNQYKASYSDCLSEDPEWVLQIKAFFEHNRSDGLKNDSVDPNLLEKDFHPIPA